MTVGRPVPWISWEEWAAVGSSLLGSDEAAQREAISQVDAWRARGANIPLGVDVTAGLVEVTLADRQHVGNDVAVQNQYAMWIVRMVNGVTGSLQKARMAQSVSILARAASLPPGLVDIRHDATHTTMPSLPLLRLSSVMALEWLASNYWERQQRQLHIDQGELQKLLREHVFLWVAANEAARTKSKRPERDQEDEVEGQEGEATLYSGMKGRKRREAIIVQLKLLVPPSAAPLIAKALLALYLRLTGEGGATATGGQLDAQDVQLGWQSAVEQLHRRYPALKPLLLLTALQRLLKEVMPNTKLVQEQKGGIDFCRTLGLLWAGTEGGAGGSAEAQVACEFEVIQWLLEECFAQSTKGPTDAEKKKQHSAAQQTGGEGQGHGREAASRNDAPGQLVELLSRSIRVASHWMATAEPQLTQNSAATHTSKAHPNPTGLTHDQCRDSLCTLLQEFRAVLESQQQLEESLEATQKVCALARHAEVALRAVDLQEPSQEVLSGRSHATNENASMHAISLGLGEENCGGSCMQEAKDDKDVGSVELSWLTAMQRQVDAAENCQVALLSKLEASHVSHNAIGPGAPIVRNLNCMTDQGPEGQDGRGQDEESREGMPRIRERVDGREGEGGEREKKKRKRWHRCSSWQPCAIGAKPCLFNPSGMPPVLTTADMALVRHTPLLVTNGAAPEAELHWKRGGHDAQEGVGGLAPTGVIAAGLREQQLPANAVPSMGIIAEEGVISVQGMAAGGLGAAGSTQVAVVGDLGERAGDYKDRGMGALGVGPMAWDAKRHATSAVSTQGYTGSKGIAPGKVTATIGAFITGQTGDEAIIGAGGEEIGEASHFGSGEGGGVQPAGQGGDSARGVIMWAGEVVDLAAVKATVQTLW